MGFVYIYNIYIVYVCRNTFGTLVDHISVVTLSLAPNLVSLESSFLDVINQR